MIEQEKHEIFEELRVFGSPEKNIAACIIGSAITALHARPLKSPNKQTHRNAETIKARWFFEEHSTKQSVSTLRYCCDALGWDREALKKAAQDPRTAVNITDCCVMLD